MTPLLILPHVNQYFLPHTLAIVQMCVYVQALANSSPHMDYTAAEDSSDA